MKLCHCGHPIIVLQGEQPEPEECFCCQHDIHLAQSRSCEKLAESLDSGGSMVRDGRD